MNDTMPNTKMLIENLSYGFALHKIITNGNGKPVDYVFVDVNPAYEQLTGLKKADIIDKRVTEVLPGLDKKWIASFGEVALSGNPVEVIDYVPELDRYYKTKAYCPEFGYFAVTFNDISERKRMEKEFIEQEKELKAILNNTPAVLMLLDQDRRVCHINRVGSEISPHNEKELPGLKCGDVLNCIYLNEGKQGCGSGKHCKTCGINNQIDRTLNTNKAHYKKPVKVTLNQKGINKVKHFLCSTEVITPETKHSILVTLEDITQQKRMEYELKEKQYQLKESNEEYMAANEELRQINEELYDMNERLYESENKYKNLFEHAQAALYRTRIDDGKLLECNPYFARLLEYESVDDCLKNYSPQKHYINSSDREFMKRLLADNGHFSDKIIEIKTAKGNLRWVKYAGKSYPDKGYLEGGVNDITTLIEGKKVLVEKQRQLQEKNEEYLAVNEELRQTNEELYDLNTLLEQTKEKLQESDKLKTSFLANISHEIRTPLNGIVGFAGLLKPGMSSNKFNQFVDIIMNSSRQLTSIIDNILDLSKIEVGVIKIKKNQFDVNEELIKLYNEFDLQAKQKGLTIDLVTDEQGYMLYTDKIRFFQVFYNLLGNALKFTDFGKITFGYKLINDKTTFFVTDTGIGIPPDEIEYVFDHFRQADTNKTKLYDGAGIGLSLVKSFVNMLGGEVWVESALNKGTTFYFTLEGLNKKIPTLTKKGARKNHKNYDWLGRHILVVEDNSVNQQLIVEMMKPFHPVVLTADNGMEALKLLKEYPSIDLVLLDIKMPVMDGYETIKRIREINPDLPVIAQTAHALTEDKEKILATGFDAYMSKPLNADKLAAVLNPFFD